MEEGEEERRKRGRQREEKQRERQIDRQEIDTDHKNQMEIFNNKFLLFFIINF